MFIDGLRDCSWITSWPKILLNLTISFRINVKLRKVQFWRVILSSLFKIFPNSPDWFLVSGQPETGANPVEKLLEAVFGGWYSASIIGVWCAYSYGSAEAFRSTLVCPVIYHSMWVYICLFKLQQWQFNNPETMPGSLMGLFHSSMAFLFGYLWYLS